jgi:hypothetical protein
MAHDLGEPCSISRCRGGVWPIGSSCTVTCSAGYVNQVTIS